MGSFRKVLSIATSYEGEIIDLTEEVRKGISSSHMSEGLSCVFVAHSTAALFLIENEAGLQRDMKDALEHLIPKEIGYEHQKKRGDGNGHSHIRASFLGSSVTIPFHNETPDLGTWQQLVLMELDNIGREREVVIQIIGV